MASRVECANYRWGHNEMESRSQQAEVDTNQALKAVSTSLSDVFV